MIRFNKNEAIDIMNTMGRQHVPFVFIIDFEMEQIILSSIEELDGSIQLQFPSFSTTSEKHNIKNYTWGISPIDFNDYTKAFHQVHDELLRGNSYLVNLTFPTNINTNLSLSEIFHGVDAKYKVLIDDEFTFFSPETFVNITDGYIYTYPMKGTIDAAEPNALEKILADKKELAEHCTIVDLLRNDLSLISKKVTVTQFRYPDYINTSGKDLIQISSEIQGKLPDNFHANIGSLIFNMLHAGSISGAPKKKTVEIIQKAEQQPRGYYTGISGYFDGNNLESAVNIRFIEQKKEGLVYRSGGGITFLSNAEKEYQELIDKVYLPLQKPVSCL